MVSQLSSSSLSKFPVLLMAESPIKSEVESSLKNLPNMFSTSSWIISSTSNDDGWDSSVTWNRHHRPWRSTSSSGHYFKWKKLSDYHIRVQRPKILQQIIVAFFYTLHLQILLLPGIQFLQKSTEIIFEWITFQLLPLKNQMMLAGIVETPPEIKVWTMFDTRQQIRSYSWTLKCHFHI